MEGFKGRKFFARERWEPRRTAQKLLGRNRAEISLSFLNFFQGAQDGANAPQNQWAAVAAAHQMALKKPSSFIVVHPAGFEPATPWTEAKYSIQLSYGCVIQLNYIIFYF